MLLKPQDKNLIHNTVSAHFCIECGDLITKARHNALLGMQLCLPCQQELDKQLAKSACSYNRCDSKDSLLR